MVSKYKISGFSLIEVVITLSVLAVVGYFISSILSVGFRENNKSSLIVNAKQNGEVALNFLDQTIRNSEKVICPAQSTISPINRITIQTKKGKIIRFKQVSPVNANSFIQEDFPALPSGSDISLICTKLDSVPNASPISVTDQNPSSGVTVSNLNFSVVKTSGYNDIVTIAFDMSPAISTPESLKYIVGSAGTIHFSTLVELR